MLVYRNLYEIGIQDRNLTIRNISIIRNSTVMNMKISVWVILELQVPLSFKRYSAWIAVLFIVMMDF